MCVSINSIPELSSHSWKSALVALFFKVTPVLTSYAAPSSAVSPPSTSIYTKLSTLDAFVLQQHYNLNAYMHWTKLFWLSSDPWSVFICQASSGRSTVLCVSTSLSAAHVHLCPRSSQDRIIFVNLPSRSSPGSQSIAFRSVTFTRNWTPILNHLLRASQRADCTSAKSSTVSAMWACTCGMCEWVGMAAEDHTATRPVWLQNVAVPVVSCSTSCWGCSYAGPFSNLSVGFTEIRILFSVITTHRLTMDLENFDNLNIPEQPHFYWQLTCSGKMQHQWWQYSHHPRVGMRWGVLPLSFFSMLFCFISHCVAFFVIHCHFSPFCFVLFQVYTCAIYAK